MNNQNAWERLETLATQFRDTHLGTLLSSPNRFDQLSFRQDHILLDLSRQRINAEILQQLVQLARQAELGNWISELFTGAEINSTEQRAALHTALRQPLPCNHLPGAAFCADVHQALDEMASMVGLLHDRQWRGYSGEPIDTLVNIGVGGSDLGPMMVCKALREFQPSSSENLEVHFISSMDGSQLSQLLPKIDPARTLFAVSSKSFSTVDTLANAATARDWLLNASNLPEELLLKRHFVGITAAPEKAIQWGIPAHNLLRFWDWVGGRYSLWSTIGFAIAVKLGMQGFRELLHGAHQLDEHFRLTPFEQNLPVLLALVEVWNINFLDIHAHAILPYDGRLAHLPAYLEQLEMESNGKSVDRAGNPLNMHTCPILWGEIGPNAQHAFYQLLHQGTVSVMCDFIVPIRRYQDNSETLQSQHRLTLANCLAQARVLALGDAALPGSDSETSAWQRYHGNQPSSLIMMDELTPSSLGALIALYEHKVFVQSVIWNINPFDQWGVELGKKMATTLLQAIEQDSSEESFDPSTRGALNLIKMMQQDSGEETA